jgi:hypothetical protein
MMGCADVYFTGWASMTGGGMQIVDEAHKIGLGDLRRMAAETFGDLVKAVVDVDRKIMVVNAELHADEEALLVQSGSRQNDLWGINFYPDLEGEDFIEFDSMINLRPSVGNRSRGVEDPETREKISRIAASLVTR